MNSFKIAAETGPYWISPKGKVYKVDEPTHEVWANINFDKSPHELLKEGWVRIQLNPSGISGIAIQVDSLNNLSESVDDFVYQNRGYYIIVDAGNKNYNINYDEFLDSGKSLRSYIESKSPIGPTSRLRGGIMNDFIKELIKEADFYKEKQEQKPIKFKVTPSEKGKDSETKEEATFMDVKNIQQVSEELRKLISDVVSLQKVESELKEKQRKFEEAQKIVHDKLHEFLKKSYISVIALVGKTPKDVIEFKKELGDVLDKKTFERYRIEQEEIEKTLLNITQLSAKVEEEFNKRILNLYDKLEKNTMYLDNVLRAMVRDASEMTYVIGAMKEVGKPERYAIYKSSVEKSLEKISQEFKNGKEIVESIRKYINEFLKDVVNSDEHFQKVVKIFESGRLADYLYVDLDEEIKQKLLGEDKLQSMIELKFKEKYPNSDIKSEVEKRIQTIKKDNKDISDDDARKMVFKELFNELGGHTYPSVYEEKGKELLQTQYREQARELLKNILLSKNPELAKDETKLNEEIDKYLSQYFKGSEDIEKILKEVQKIPLPHLEKELKKSFLEKIIINKDYKKIDLISKLLESNYDLNTAIQVIATISDISIPEVEALSSALDALNTTAELIISESNKLQESIANIKEAGKEIEEVLSKKVETEVEPTFQPEFALAPASLKSKIDIK